MNHSLVTGNHPLRKSSSVFSAAFAYSVPVLLGYIAIGMAFGLLITDAGYPVWLALFMSLWMYAGAGQYIAVGLFTGGAGLLQAVLIQLVVNARHMAYGISMINRFPKKSAAKPYLIFSMTDETFALLSSFSPGVGGIAEKDKGRFMLYVSVLDQFYWVAGSLLGAAAGSLIPFSMDGIGFALTALFIVLFLEQIFRYAGSGAKSPAVKKAGVFIVSAFAALAAVFLLPESFSLLAGMVLAILLCLGLEFKK